MESDAQLNELKSQFTKSLDESHSHMVDEFTKLQIGRAHPGLVEHINVDAYGSSQPMKM